MTRIEHLLVILMEECNEVSQRASKALRFTLDEVQPGQELSNEDRIWREFEDLMGVMELLKNERRHSGIQAELVSAKMSKVERFLMYSKDVGTLT